MKKEIKEELRDKINNFVFELPESNNKIDLIRAFKKQLKEEFGIEEIKEKIIKGQNRFCENCRKDVFENARHNKVKVGTMQIGQGKNKPLLSFCNKICYNEFKELKQKLSNAEQDKRAGI